MFDECLDFICVEEKDKIVASAIEFYFVFL